jgi:hypothetical protein
LFERTVRSVSCFPCGSHKFNVTSLYRRDSHTPLLQSDSVDGLWCSCGRAVVGLLSDTRLLLHVASLRLWYSRPSSGRLVCSLVARTSLDIDALTWQSIYPKSLLLVSRTTPAIGYCRSPCGISSSSALSPWLPTLCSCRSFQRVLACIRCCAIAVPPASAVYRNRLHSRWS